MKVIMIIQILYVSNKVNSKAKNTFQFTYFYLYLLFVFIICIYYFNIYIFYNNIDLMGERIYEKNIL